MSGLNSGRAPGATRPVLKEPKSEAGRRPVAIPAHIMPLVEAHLERYVGPGPRAGLGRHSRTGSPCCPATSTGRGRRPARQWRPS